MATAISSGGFGRYDKAGPAGISQDYPNEQKPAIDSGRAGVKGEKYPSECSVGHFEY